jgi:hypothetical protein
MPRQKRPRTYGRNRARGYHEKLYESDSTYFLKLVVCALLGTFWLKFAQPVEWLGVPFGGIPVGLFIGLILVRYFEKFQSDRKIWYAILLVVTIISHFVPAGIVI